jgi:predicted membrane-bound spermidine synthase
MSATLGRAPVTLLVATTLSGAAALLYETLWARSLAIVLGSTVQANAAIFAAFLVGLAVGAYSFGRIVSRVQRVARAYALTELLIGATALSAGLLIHHYRIDLAAAVGVFGSQGRLFSAFFIVLAMISVPTWLMGATFPLLLQLATRFGTGTQGLYAVYALNTFGAAAGTLAAGTVAIPSLGVTGALCLAAFMNLWVALLTLTLRESALPPVDDQGPNEPVRVLGRSESALLLVSAFSSGAIGLALEVLWSRLASYFLGNRTFAFTVFLAWVLLLLSAGSAIARLLARRIDGRLPATFGAIYVVAGVCLCISTAMAWWWIEHQELIEPKLPGGSSLLLVYRCLETGLLLGPMLVLGTIFPLSLLCMPDVVREVGRIGGRFYFVNTLGAVLGSLVAGSWGVTQLGTFVSMALLIVWCALLGAGFFVVGMVRAVDRRAKRIHLAALVVALASLNLIPAIMPQRLELVARGHELLFRREDEYGVLEILRAPDRTIRSLNNRTELVFHLGRPETSYVQEMQGHLGMVYCPEAERALVLGSGYGITAGTLGLYPQLRSIEAVEIIPGMIEAAELFEPYNFSYQKNPKIHVAADDGRHYLARSRDRFDIISVNVSDAHQPGGSSLFHEDFYEVAKSHLTDRGVVVQHAFGEDMPIVMATLRRSFPHLILTRAYGNGYNVVASTRPLVAERGRTEQLLRAPLVRASLHDLGLVPPVDPTRVLLQTLTLPRADEDAVAVASTATDDRPRLEFSFTGHAGQWLFSNE